MAIIRKYKTSTETFMEIFGTTKPSQSAIIKWKARWRATKGRVEVASFIEAIKFLEESGIAPLFYQFSSDPGEFPETTGKIFIVFYDGEHEVFFKLHSDLA